MRTAFHVHSAFMLADLHLFNDFSFDRLTTNVHKSLPPTTKDIKPSLINRITSKLHITVPTATSSAQPTSSATRPSHSWAEAKHSLLPPRSPRTTPTLPNSFVSRENREAALRERGLRPPPKDLSEQEREADERLAPAPLPVHEQGNNGSSAASRIKEEWLFMNRSSFPPTSMTT
ncbi:hypothetical protein K503DRAFT_773722 [Rhizopogon vinicolor AM-OR11-026]|uniref:Uncharacterized protein n=1 Tax=Rhizopogon vinicolor AM-OR11-026 TaxID=1314800 RepID=A0A1B7MRJ4_9AGAM|nr:hypothetical protein K503DRAFT_773722 [Rhizopogon vinicolor AM-OR11-026]